MTAAHTSLPIPTYVRVTNLDNGRTAVVRVNDRGPFHGGRIIDLSYSAANKLGVIATGTARVEVEALHPYQSLAGRAPPARKAPATQPPRAVHASTKGETSKLYLQVGAFSNADNAERLRARLAGSLGDRVEVHTVPNISGAYRVRVGPLNNGQDADSIAQRLVAQGITDSHVVYY
jgi:rare lipoprotein A